MAGPGISSGEQGPAADGAVADYLAAVAAWLRGPVAARTRVALAGRAAGRCLATRATLS
jgi:hypothetical protein